MTFFPLQTTPPWVFCMMAQTRLFNVREAYMAIKAIAMDIDGTLTNDQKVISPRTREKLLAAQESGI